MTQFSEVARRLAPHVAVVKPSELAELIRSNLIPPGEEPAEEEAASTAFAANEYHGLPHVSEDDAPDQQQRPHTAASAAARVPSLNVTFTAQAPGYGVPVLNGTAVKVLNATNATEGGTGVYNHAPMISLHSGVLLLSWKNAPSAEDVPGQRILYSYASAESAAARSERAWSAPAVLFPGFPHGHGASGDARDGASSGAGHGRDHPPIGPPLPTPGATALYALPTAVLNGRVYAAASPIQGELLPYPYMRWTLLRRIDFFGASSPPTLGPIFWATEEPPDGYATVSKQLGIGTLRTVDAQTRLDVAALTRPGTLPCDPHGGRCEACLNGCQPLSYVYNTPRTPGCSIIDDPPQAWIERTHYSLPDQAGSVGEDILLYRTNALHLCFSRRVGVSANWSAIAQTNIPDVVSNHNAGRLPDGRTFLLHNPVVQSKDRRDPLVVSLSSDGYVFNRSFVVASCASAEYRSPEQPDGCKPRTTSRGGCRARSILKGLSTRGSACSLWRSASTRRTYGSRAFSCARCEQPTGRDVE